MFWRDEDGLGCYDAQGLEGLFCRRTLFTPDSESMDKPTVVGIGASAGGLAALKRLFELIPADSGLAFVVVVHLSPEHKSFLSDLLQPSVRFPVRQVTETTLLEVNNVYVIPPNANLSAIDTHLRLSRLEEARRERAPIDHFFRTLASTHDGHSVGVILTGTGSDGTLGLKEIKAKGGLILVQDPRDAEFDGMPQSAIATGLVDRILPIAEIPEALLRLTQVERRIALGEAGQDVTQPEFSILPKVLAILKARTDRDFSRYKPATIFRRIGRRMQLNYIEKFGQYLEKLRESQEETRALADDLLITVTSFFRDADVFHKLQKDILPHLFEGKGPADNIRVWSVGCATGEEAYSLAMILLEEAARWETPPKIQIFASDMHRRSLDRAREGVYSGDIETDVSADRLKRFFQQENGGFRISKQVRDAVVFAPHNLLGDPPFSQLNLIACRNLLIYLDRSVQRDVIDLFHYALCPSGFLLLGSAETIDASELFRTEDKRMCVYQKRNVPAPEPRLPVFPFTSQRIQRRPDPRSEEAAETIRYQSLHLDLLERYAPPSILIGPDNKLVHLSENAGRYLIHPGGETTLSAARLVRSELRLELQALLQTARDKKEPQDSKAIPVRFNGHSSPVVMHVRSARELDQEGFVLVIFEEHKPEPEPVGVRSPHDSSPERGHAEKRIAELEAELNISRQRLQSIIEEYETSREEMKASNEEMQSTNEELRSTMEELETSKEELQSINEELQTVNQENRHKVEELSQLSGDLQNLLSATDIATLFLDRDLRILRFTPKLADLFSVRVIDRGRPISDLTHRLGYEQLGEDAQAVLSHLIPIEQEIQDDSGRWYLTRLLPYRSTEDRIEGVVVTFTEITTRKLAEAGLRESEERQTLLVKLSDTLQTITSADEIQRAALQLLGEHLGLSRLFYFHVEREDDGWAHVVDLEYRRDPGLPGMVGRHSLKHFGSRLFEGFVKGKAVEVSDVAALEGLTPEEIVSYRKLGVVAFLNLPLLWNGEYSTGITAHDTKPRTWRPVEISLIHEITTRAWNTIERMRAKEALRESEQRFRTLADTSTALIWQTDDRGENLFSNRYFLDYTGRTAEEIHGTGWQTLIHPDDAPGYIAEYTEAIHQRHPFSNQSRIRQFDGKWHWFVNHAQPLFSQDGRYVGHVGTSLDVNGLRESEERQRVLLEGMPQLVWRAQDNGEWIWASPQWASFTGQNPEQSMGEGWLDSLHPDDRETARHAWVQAREEGLLDVEYRVRRARDGAYLWHHTRALPVRAPDGKILEWLGTSTDIEKLKQAESARLEVEEKFRLFVENVQEYALVQTDPKGFVTSWNPGAQRLFGYRIEQIVGKNFAVLLNEKDRADGLFERELAQVTNGQRCEDARWLVRNDGSRFWTRWITEPMRDDTGRFRGLARIMRDETERERVEALTRHSLAEKEELLKEVHHRVKNNLQVIISLLNMQTSQIQDDRVLALFQETRNRVLSISSIHELLYSAKSFAKIVLTDYARQLVPGLVRFYGLEGRVRVEVAGDGATLELERAVPYGILLNELISNACKHAFPSPEEGTIAVSIESEGRSIVLTVADNGQGLPGGFDYHKAPSLGLKLVHGLVRQLRGTIEIRSKPGTTIKVRFPANSADRQNELET